MRKPLAVLCAATLAAVATGSCSSTPRVANPLAGAALAVVPGAAATASRQLKVAGDADAARLIERLAEQPTASWVTDGSPQAVKAKVRAVVRAAAGRTAVLVAYDLPGRDCGGYSAGGTTDASRYAAWVTGIAAGLEQASVIIVLEPDAVPQTLQGRCPPLNSATAAAKPGSTAVCGVEG